jgi:hypothetical protein
MAGFTDFAVGFVRSQRVMIPYYILERSRTRSLKRKDAEWIRLLGLTGQTSFLSPENQAKALEVEQEFQLKRKKIYTDLKLKIALGFEDLDAELEEVFANARLLSDDMQC